MSNVSRPERSRQPNNRLSEMLAVLLLGIATIGTAWCGYQASRWNQEQGDISREGSDLRIEANRQFGLATQAIVYDANLVAQYAKAVVDGDTRLQQFFRTTLFRPAFLPVLERWEEAIKAGETPPNLLEDSDYGQVVIRVRPDDAPEVAKRLTVLRDEYEQTFALALSGLPLPPRTDRRALRLMLLGALNWSQTWYRTGKDSPQVLARRFVRLLREPLDD